MVRFISSSFFLQFLQNMVLWHFPWGSGDQAGRTDRASWSCVPCAGTGYPRLWKKAGAGTDVPASKRPWDHPNVLLFTNDRPADCRPLLPDENSTGAVIFGGLPKVKWEDGGQHPDFCVIVEFIIQKGFFVPILVSVFSVMYYYLRMTDPQIAAVLDVGKTTVHRRRHEAIKKLHILLEDEKWSVCRSLSLRLIVEKDCSNFSLAAWRLRAFNTDLSIADLM
mgnify:CR=1 FL=1